MALNLTESGQLYNDVRANNVFLRRLVLACKIKANEFRTTETSETGTFPTQTYADKILPVANRILSITEIGPNNSTVNLLIQAMVIEFRDALDDIPVLNDVPDGAIENRVLAILESMAGINPADK
jgi:hypothetical protein